jgi:hypothetical protein
VARVTQFAELSIKLKTQIRRAKLLLVPKHALLGLALSVYRNWLSELAEFFAMGDEIRIGAGTELVEIQTLPFPLQNHALGPDSI